MKLHSKKRTRAVFSLNIIMLAMAAVTSLPAFSASLTEDYDKDGIVDIQGGPLSNMLSLSASGDIAVGNSMVNGLSRATIWTAKKGVQILPDTQQFGPVLMTAANSVSQDGSYIVGNLLPKNGAMQALLWTNQSHVSVLTPLVTQSSSYASAISANNAVIVGASTTENNLDHAVYWDRSTGQIHDLGSLNTKGDGFSTATATNTDGSVIVGGTNTNTNVQQAFRWQKETGMVALQTLQGSSQASGISESGRIIGSSTNSAGNMRAVYWDNKNITDLGTLRADNSGFSSATGINQQGNVIVGAADFDAPSALGSPANDNAKLLGFIWTEGAGMHSVNDWLTAGHVNAGNMVANTVNAISENGETIAGQLNNGHGYVAHILALKHPESPINPKPPVNPEPPVNPNPEKPQPSEPDHDKASGIVDVTQVNSSLFHVQRNLEIQRQLIDDAANNADCASFGPTGLCVKATVAVRHREAHYGDYTSPAASITLASRLSDSAWRSGISLSMATMNIRDELGGKISQNAPAVSLFAGYGDDSSAGWKGYAGLSYLNAGMDIDRAYNNGVLTEVGHGHTRSRAVNLTVKGGYTYQITPTYQVTPFVAISQDNLHWNGYSEANNSPFTARFSDQNSHITTAKVGAINTLAINGQSDVSFTLTLAKNLRQHNSTGIATVMNGFGGLATQYRMADIDKIMPEAQVSYGHHIGTNQAVSVFAGYQDVGFGSGQSSAGVSYRMSF